MNVPNQLMGEIIEVKINKNGMCPQEISDKYKIKTNLIIRNETNTHTHSLRQINVDKAIKMSF